MAKVGPLVFYLERRRMASKRAITRDDGVSPGIQCAAVEAAAGRCTRDTCHPGAHVARSSVPEHGFIGWRNRHPGQPA